MLSIVKSWLKGTPLYARARSMLRKRRRPRHPLQDVKMRKTSGLIRLGTAYGGWMFEDHASLHNCTIISAGLGEDASFDVAFAKKYGATVIVVDPTPRAIRHFDEISKRWGRPNERKFVGGGEQPVDAYDLAELSAENFILSPKALWREDGRLRFFAPSDPAYVSHSLTNYRNGYADTGAHIEVDAVTMGGLLDELNVPAEEVPLVKLDIEGAEIEVLCEFLGKGFSPRQILVEFDELQVPSDAAFERVDMAHRALLEHGYACVYTDGETDFLFVRS